MNELEKLQKRLAKAKAAKKAAEEIMETKSKELYDNKVELEKQISRLQKRLAREKTARKEAERIMEQKSRELYATNQELISVNQNLEQIVADRTEALRLNLEKVNKINEELMDITYVVSHEVRGSVRQVGGLISLIEEETKLEEESLEFMTEIKDRVARVYHFLDGLREYIFIGRKSIEAQPIELRKVLKQIVNTLDLPQGFSIKIDKNLPILNVNPHRCHQVFQHLIQNAIQYHHQPNQGEIIITFQQNEYEGIIIIKDNGPGIAESYHEKIFKLFQLLHTRGSKNGKGVGLSIVKKIIESWNGYISIASSKGNGAAFNIVLPNELILKEENQ